MNNEQMERIVEIKITIETSKGPININMFPEKVPVTTANFLNLAKKGFYDGLSFHRVIPNFMIQGGCPLGTGTGGPGYRFEDEFDASLRQDSAGKLSMANAGPGTNGSQFFITHGPTPHLDDAHSVFGEVASDADQVVVDSVEQGDNITRISMTGDVDAFLASQQARIDEWDKAAS
jgi:peptidyl-prolyl cis-trans isomerase B (cyclophilin B)